MQVKIEKADGSVIISDVTSVTILSTESQVLEFQDGRTMVQTLAPLTFNDVVAVHRTTKAPAG